MKTHNKKDELLVQIGTSISLRIISNEIEANKALDNKYYSTVAGFNNVNIGLKTSLSEIGKNFGNSTNPVKVRIGSYFEAVNDRMKWLNDQDNK